MILVKKSQNSGFSLIELLTVVILLGILAVVALGRLGNPDALVARGFFDDTVAAVRFAQKLAVSSGCDVRVVTTASGYALRQSSTCTADDFTSPVANPADRGSNYANNSIPAGFGLTAGTITFNSRGEREAGGPPVFVLTDGGTSYSFRVHAVTGLVEVL